MTNPIPSELELEVLVRELGAHEVPCSGPARPASAPSGHGSPRELRRLVAEVRGRIRKGEDPLGDFFCQLRSPALRRARGATYTPIEIVRSMVRWAKRRGQPDRVVDPGSGSGRFLVEAGRAFPRAALVAVELDPLAALLARAHLASSGLADRASVIVGDYRTANLSGFLGRTLFIGNPPYVRHHLLDAYWKSWLTRSAKRLGHSASQLAGLHAHFLLATALHVRTGDDGVFITSAEWLDVNYGALVRDLFLSELGGLELHLIEPSAVTFPDAATTAVILCFRAGERPRTIRVRRIQSARELGSLGGGKIVRRERLEAASRWTPLTRTTRRPPVGFVELGELCRVRRGQVTGDNGFWISGPHSAGVPERFLFHAITRAREIYQAGPVIDHPANLRRVIDLPEDLDRIEASERRPVETLLALAKTRGVPKGYIASHRRSWWSVGLYEPAPIVATYMARRPPGFARNLGGVRHINIAHGIYPRQPLTISALDSLVNHLSANTSLSGGRTYAGGLTKFEPKEMERILVPLPECLERSIP